MLVEEGGYVNHSRDPGGATMKGVTQAVYDDYRRRTGQPRRSVRQIADAELAAIYRNEYWDAINGDNLPAGVDYATFDLAVNSGVGRAARFLQNVLGVVEDGKIGPKTIAAIEMPSFIAGKLCDKRLAFLRALNTFTTFGRGWTARVARVKAKAQEMAA